MVKKKKEKANRHGNEQGWRTLGIIGAGRCTGVTHLAVWSANYLTGVHRKKTAVLEWNSHGDFMHMARNCRCKNGTYQPFEVLGVRYFAAAGRKELADCLEQDYACILIDFGELTEERLCECARCDRRVAVGSLSEWQSEAFLEFVKEKSGRECSWEFAAAFGSEETRKEWEKAFRTRLLRIPVSVDAFAVTRKDMYFFEKLLPEPRVW